MILGDLLRQAVEAFHGGRLDEARRMCVLGVSHAPWEGRFHRLLGVCLYNQGDLGGAALQFRRLVVLDPADPMAWSLVQRGMAANGDAAGLERASAAAVRLDPLDPTAFTMRARIASGRGDHALAIASSRQAIAVRPNDSEALSCAALALQGAGLLNDSVPAFRRALAVTPRDANLLNLLGISLQRLGRYAEAASVYQQAILLAPAMADYLGNLGAAFYQGNRFQDARVVLGLAAAADPSNHLVPNTMGLVLGHLSAPSEAIRSFRRAVALRPDRPDPFVNMAQAHLGCGEAAHALAMNRLARIQAPNDPVSAANGLMYLNYDPAADPETVAALHREWAREHADPLTPQGHFATHWDGERRIRVGYVSADFWWHSVSYFFEPLLDAHDRARVEIFCYSDSRQQDVVSERLQAKSDHWRRTIGRGDAEVFDMIRADGIDVLVDLGGHTADNRLRVFARRPAPVQVTWLGYPHSTGVGAIGYRISDAITDPAPEADGWNAERVVRLPGGFHCYRPHVSVEPAADPPSRAAGHVTFGSFNNMAKLNEPLLSAWADLLGRVEGSRLLLKGRGFVDPGVAGRHREFFQKRGIDPSRLSLVTYLGSQTDHLRAYDGIDIALDSFPYNGTTTTCEALWMGVPVIGLLGRGHAGRVGASLLSQLGLLDLIAADPADYVDTAVRLARDPARLARLRSDLRPRMLASTLCDAPFLARKLEAAYVEMLLLASQAAKSASSRPSVAGQPPGPGWR
ncbi:MAG: tetratricopeptide repeat protein [Alphaproteobacteria bacterium]|nr:tetratricopeptide repeat protein [Alphaproteobacteria bacterium]